MKKAFTLIEILLVILILGILAAIVIPQFRDEFKTAEPNNTQQVTVEPNETAN